MGERASPPRSTCLSSPDRDLFCPRLVVTIYTHSHAGTCRKRVKTSMIAENLVQFFGDIPKFDSLVQITQADRYIGLLNIVLGQLILKVCYQTRMQYMTRLAIHTNLKKIVHYFYLIAHNGPRPQAHPLHHLSYWSALYLICIFICI